MDNPGTLGIARKSPNNKPRSTKSKLGKIIPGGKK